MNTVVTLKVFLSSIQSKTLAKSQLCQAKQSKSIAEYASRTALLMSPGLTL